MARHLLCLYYKNKNKLATANNNKTNRLQHNKNNRAKAQLTDSFGVELQRDYPLMGSDKNKNCIEQNEPVRPCKLGDQSNPFANHLHMEIPERP